MPSSRKSKSNKAKPEDGDDRTPIDTVKIKESIADAMQAVQRSSGSHEKRRNALLELHKQSPPMACTEALSSFILYQLYEASGVSSESYKRVMNFVKDYFTELHRNSESDVEGIRMIRYFLPFENGKDKVIRQRVVHLLHQLLQTLDSKQESPERNALYDSIVDIFKRRLHDKSAVVAEQAARACACFISQEDVLQQLLCLMCTSDSPIARAAVVNALTRTPPSDTNIVLHVLRGTRDTHSSVRKEAWEGLAKMRWGRFVAYAGENIIPYLHHGIIDVSPSVQSAFAKTILSAWVTRDNSNDIMGMIKRIQAPIVNDYARYSDHIDVIVQYLLRHVRRLAPQSSVIQLDLAQMSTHNTLLWRLSTKLEHEAEAADAPARAIDGFTTSTPSAIDALTFTDFSKILQTIAIRIHEPNKAAPKGAPTIHVADFENESLLIVRHLLLMVPVYHASGILATATERDLHTMKTSFALLLTAAIEDDARILVEECMQAAALCIPNDALIELLLTALNRLYNNLGVVARAHICIDDVEAYLQGERARKTNLSVLRRKKAREASADVERELEIDRIYLLRIAFLIHCWISAQRRKDVQIPGVFLQLLKVCRCTCISDEVNAQAVRATALLCMLNRETAITMIPVIQSMLDAAKDGSEVREACYQALIDNMCEYECGMFLPPASNALRPDPATQQSQSESTQRDDTEAAKEQYANLLTELIKICTAQRLTTVVIGICKLLACGGIRAEECGPAVKMLVLELFRLQQQSNSSSGDVQPAKQEKPGDRFRTTHTGSISAIISCLDSFLTHYAHSHPRRMYAVAKACVAACQEIFAADVASKGPKRGRSNAQPQTFTQSDFRRLWRRILHFTDAWYLQCVRQLDPSAINEQRGDGDSDASDNEIFDYRANQSMLVDDDRSKSMQNAIYGKSVARELSRCSCHEFITLGVLVELLCLPEDVAARIIPELTRIRLYKKDDKVLLRQLVVATQRCVDHIQTSSSVETLEKPLKRILATLRTIVGGDFLEAQHSYSQGVALPAIDDESKLNDWSETPIIDHHTVCSDVTRGRPSKNKSENQSARATRCQSDSKSNVAYAYSIGTTAQEANDIDAETVHRNVLETEKSVDSMIRMRKSDMGENNVPKHPHRSGDDEPSVSHNIERTTESLSSESPNSTRKRSADSSEPVRVYSLRKR